MVEFQYKLWMLILAVVLSQVASGQEGFGKKESSLSKSVINMFQPQHQAGSDSFESIREEVVTCDPRVDKACSQNYLPVCGSNGETYNNEEELKRAMEMRPELRMAHEGMCLGFESLTGLDENKLIPQGVESFSDINFGQ